MRKALLLSSMLMFSGCAIFNQPLRSDAAALQAQADADLDKMSFIDSKVQMYERAGASRAAAQATAATDYNMQAATGHR